MASCSDDGRVTLINLHNGRRLGRDAVGGGEALPGLSAPGHFEVRADPGPRLAILSGSRHGLRLVETKEVPEVGHCLTGDGHGRYWTCDADNGRILQFSDR